VRVFYPPGIVLVLRSPGGGGALGFRTPSGITPVPGALPRGLSYSNASGAIFYDFLCLAAGAVGELDV